MCIWGFSGSSAGKESAYNAGDPGLMPGSGRFMGEGIGYLLQYSGLENLMHGVVHGVAKSQTLLMTFTSLPSSKSYDKLTGKYLQPFNKKMGFPLGNL